MKTTINILLALMTTGSAIGQIRIDKPILFDGPNESTRQITGIAPSLQPTSLMPASVLVSGAFRTSLPTTGTQWNISLEGLEQIPVAGCQIVLITPPASGSQVFLSVNGSTPYNVILAPNAPLFDDYFSEGAMLSLVFDGNAFQVTNGVRHKLRDCPSDMVPINTEACIEPFERQPQTFYNASLICGQQNKRLCSWSEFYIACEQRSALGLDAMLGNWEWTGSSADSDRHVRVVGQSICTSAGRLHAGNFSNPYRCCYTR